MFFWIGVTVTFKRRRQDIHSHDFDEKDELKMSVRATLSCMDMNSMFTAKMQKREESSAANANLIQKIQKMNENSKADNITSLRNQAKFNETSIEVREASREINECLREYEPKSERRRRKIVCLRDIQGVNDKFNIMEKDVHEKVEVLVNGVDRILLHSLEA
ncbi:hypothetical protein EVAR_72043_1 [Eumeta japonica]|uniref:Uncharacterized protein n=1 Tax=Eumeta variegata TaxID=151549 RepID=A0A4C1T9U9_EUMVA|nr:hypothetical protein EVAR_72043_1 [Eumeta japonica]